jgi:hypothetical protein
MTPQMDTFSARPTSHRIPTNDSIDHDVTATHPEALEQCVCGPRWTVVPLQFYALHHVLLRIPAL